jgi:hypothetical protein
MDIFYPWFGILLQNVSMYKPPTVVTVDFTNLYWSLRCVRDPGKIVSDQGVKKHRIPDPQRRDFRYVSAKKVIIKLHTVDIRSYVNLELLILKF